MRYPTLNRIQTTHEPAHNMLSTMFANNKTLFLLLSLSLLSSVLGQCCHFYSHLGVAFVRSVCLFTVKTIVLSIIRFCLLSFTPLLFTCRQQVGAPDHIVVFTFLITSCHSSNIVRCFPAAGSSGYQAFGFMYHFQQERFYLFTFGCCLIQLREDWWSVNTLKNYACCIGVSNWINILSENN